MNVALALTFFLMAFGMATLASAGDGKVVRGAGHEGFDSSVRPQDDFFRHVNGEWIKKTEIPGDRPAFGSFFQLRDKSESDIRAIIEEAAAKSDSSKGSEGQKIGDLYKSFMDVARRKSSARSRLKPTWRGSMRSRTKRRSFRPWPSFSARA